MSRLTLIAEWKDDAEDSLPEHRTQAGGAQFDNGKLIMTGGRDLSGEATASTWLYNRRQWKDLPSLIIPRHSHGCITYQHKVYVFGGYNWSDRMIKSVEVLDLKNLSAGWKMMPALHYPRVPLAVEVVQNKIYVVGGGEYCDDAIECFDLATNQWERNGVKAPTIPVNDTWVAGSTVYQNKYICIIGEHTPETGSCLMAFDVSSLRWVPSMQIPVIEVDPVESDVLTAIHYKHNGDSGRGGVSGHKNRSRKPGGGRRGGGGSNGAGWRKIFCAMLFVFVLAGATAGALFYFKPWETKATSSDQSALSGSASIQTASNPTPSPTFPSWFIKPTISTADEASKEVTNVLDELFEEGVGNEETTTVEPTTVEPTFDPSANPTKAPVENPTRVPTRAPTRSPTRPPTAVPAVVVDQEANNNNDGNDKPGFSLEGYDQVSSLLSSIQGESCSICGPNMVVGNPDAIFTFVGREDESCGSLEAKGRQGLLGSTECIVLIPFVKEVCECEDQAPPTASPTMTFPPSTTMQPSESVSPTNEPCSVCGKDKVVNDPDSIFSFPEREDETCGDLEARGLAGMIAATECTFLAPVIEDICACASLPTSSPSAVPTGLPTATPSQSFIPTTKSCSVCGEGRQVGDRDVLWDPEDKFDDIVGPPEETCGDLEDRGLAGFVTLTECRFFPTIVLDACACQDVPTSAPSATPTDLPSITALPSEYPTTSPTVSAKPSLRPTAAPTTSPSSNPTVSAMPTTTPTVSVMPTSSPSVSPTDVPSATPTTSQNPTLAPTVSAEPTNIPTESPSESPTDLPTVSSLPSVLPTISTMPSSAPSLPCQDDPPDWFTLGIDGTPIGCPWYEEDSTRCTSFGDEINDFNCTAKEACCACGGGCNDDRFLMVFVEDTGRDEPCVWLADRMDVFSPTLNDTYSVMCEDPDGFGGICKETCGTCYDTVFDTEGEFLYEGIYRDCLWLSLRTDVQDEVCDDWESDAYKTCPEACTLFSVCNNFPEFYQDKNGNDCSFYQHIPYERCEDFGDIPNREGVSPNDACCICGGGRDKMTLEPSASPSLSCQDTPLDWFTTEISGIPVADCFWYGDDAEMRCQDYGDVIDVRNNYSANEACCACGGGCNDDRFKTVFVEDTGREEPCVWLAARLDVYSPSLGDNYSVLCNDEGGFGGICKETCGQCYDTVFDDTDGKFIYEGFTRDCLWLSLRTDVQDILCSDRESDAFQACEESCTLFSICDDSPNEFVDINGHTCAYYQTSRFHRCSAEGGIPNESGVTANEACCICGGGVDKPSFY